MFAFEGYEFDFGIPVPDLAVALSGGADSMALAWLLSRWAAENDVCVHALTVDHGLRSEAADEARQVGSWIARWPQIKHEVLKLDLSGDVRVMERARDGRYEVLAAYCRTHKIDRLYVAHHLDDQAETFLFRLAKGSGLDGLSAMRHVHMKRGLQIVRPLLDVPKEQLVDLCRAHDIPFVDDPSNEDTKYARPRLRQSRTVLEEEGLSAKRLAVTAARLGRAREALDHYADAAFQKNVKPHGVDKITLDYEGLKNEPAEIRLRVLILALERMNPVADGYGPRREKMEDLAVALFDKGSFRKQTLGGCIFERNTVITIARESA